MISTRPDFVSTLVSLGIRFAHSDRQDTILQRPDRYGGEEESGFRRERRTAVEPGKNRVNRFDAKRGGSIDPQAKKKTSFYKFACAFS